MNYSEENAWFCIRSVPKSEHIAAAHLRVLPNVEVFCPRLRLKKMTRRGPVLFTEALFPGYLFARFEPMASQKLVTYAQSVVGIVRFGPFPAVVPEHAIDDLRREMGETECRTLDQEIREGDGVVITSGVFQGISTVVTRLRDGNARVKVLIEFLGQCREVEVSRGDLLADQRHILAV